MMLFLRKRRVRVHLADDKPSIDGIWVGNAAGHYRIANAELVSEAGDVQVEGEAWVPADRVLWLQVFA